MTRIITRVRNKIEEKAQFETDKLMVQAQAKYIEDLMKEEGCDREEAWAIVEGRTDPIEYEHTLGFKLANPILMLALFSKLNGKKARRQAAENFAATLSEPEREIFYSKVFTEENAEKFKAEYKKQKKNKK